jgi:fatty-acyl-CoA synthase
MRTVQKTIGKTFSRCAQTYPNHDALIHTDVGVRYNYSLLLWEVERAAKGLIKMGIEKGDRVALWSPNIPEWVVGQLALAKVGAILVPIDPSAAPSDLRFMLEQSESRAIIMAIGVEDEDYVEMMLDVRDQVRHLEHIFPYRGVPSK